MDGWIVQNAFLYPKHALSSCLLLTDVNDNVPFFTSSIYEASVTEGAESGTLVFQVSANDLDLGLNGKVKENRFTHAKTKHGEHNIPNIPEYL